VCMGRKSKKGKRLDPNSADWWERRLQNEGLGVDRGTSRKLVYVGGNKALDVVERTHEDRTESEFSKKSEKETEITPSPVKTYRPARPI
jgi:hypothetical protein